MSKIGVPSEEIIKAINLYKADMLVLGVHGIHRGIAYLMLGSNTEKILLSATCPTLTVGAHVLGGVKLGLRPKEIIYISDFSSEAAAAAPYALLLAKEFEVPLDVCQLMPEIAEDNADIRQKLAERYCERMAQLTSKLRTEWSLPAFHLEHGMEMDQIIKRAATQLAGLIVLGVRTRSHLGRRLHTSFAYQLLAKATCPVLTIRDQRSS